MTPADVQHLAQKYLAREDLVTVIAGDEAQQPPAPEERQAPEEKADRQ